MASRTRIGRGVKKQQYPPQQHARFAMLLLRCVIWVAVCVGVMGQSTSSLIVFKLREQAGQPDVAPVPSVPLVQGRGVRFGSPQPAPYALVVNRLGIRLVREIRRSDGDQQNVLFSPLSIAGALALMHLGAEGEARRELEKAFGFEERNISSMILEKGKTSDAGNGTAVIASKGFVAEGIKLLKSYKKAVGENIIKGLPFSTDPEGVRQQINDNVSNATEGFIEEALEKDSIKAPTNLLLMSTGFFHGVWETSFEEENTIKHSFQGVAGTQEVDFISVSMPNLLWRSVPELNSEAVELPYAGGTFSMFIVRPDRSDGYRAAEENLHRVVPKGLLFTGAEMRKFDSFRMPKFELTNDITSLKGYLQALRLGGVFSHSGLTGISRQQPIVADVNHKTLIKIDEKGAMGAKDTVGLFQNSTVMKDFIVDHPFLFFIVDKGAGTVWFQGTVTML